MMRSTAAWLLTLTPALALALPASVAAQRSVPRDTVVSLDALVVTADRIETPLAASIAAVTVLTKSQLEGVPHVTLADALRHVPGFALVNFDGLGYDPQLTVRGFYGGGEAEYVLVLLDGRPLNNVQAGLVEWDAIPLAAAERVEIVRGGASALWGDAAVGGVINVVTRSAGEPSVQGRITGGSHGTWRGGANAQGTIADRDASIFGEVDRTDGFRDHAARTTGQAGGTFALGSGPAASLRLTGLAHWRAFDVPGPLLDEDLAASRAASDVFYRFDRSDERAYRLGIDAERALGTRSRISAAIAGDARDTEAVRTIALAPDFADTKERVLDTARGVATAQLDVEGTGLPLEDRLVVGIDASYATLDSRYYAVLTGGRDAYRSASGERGDLDAGGSGRRGAAAAFAQYTVFPVDAVRISAGARADWLRDTFTASDPEDGESLDAAHAAFSPRIGANVQYMQGAAHTGNVYVTAGRSFKAPTLDQLFDQRRLPVPFPPGAITTSNALLEPQHGTSLEAGLFHGMALVPGALAGEITVAVYQMDMKNELDFDIQTLRYINIGRSRHRGVETGIRIQGPRAASIFANYTLQDVTARSGEDAGRQLKAVPRHFLSGGLSVTAIGSLETGLMVSHARDIFLDDANTLTLPPYTRVDARVSHPAAGLRLFLDVRNLFDARYSTTGFPDPSGSGAIYYHPAAGRTIDFGIRAGA
jgi:iron complex outermembrane receptor protein